MIMTWCIPVCVLLAVTALAAGQAGQLYASAPQSRGQYYRGSSGSYNYGYNTGDGVAKVEVKRGDGSVVGSYRYFDPSGKQIVRSYIADSNGFRILGNDLPIALDTPAAAVLGAPALTASVEGAAQNIVDAAQHPSKPHFTVDISRISAPQGAPDFNARSDGSEATGAEINPYYYFPYQYNYHFPAGFAYPTSLMPVPPPEVVGARFNEEPNLNTLAVGRGAGQYRQTSSDVISTEGRRYRPLFQRPEYVIGRRA